MSRPCKQRRICALPRCPRFGPQNHTADPCPPIAMSLDEFECIRLIDLEGLTQAQCAQQMNIARTTAQAIYGSARIKLARCLVEEKTLLIGGGDYVLCQGGEEAQNSCCPRGRRCPRRPEPPKQS